MSPGLLYPASEHTTAPILAGAKPAVETATEHDQPGDSRYLVESHRPAFVDFSTLAADDLVVRYVDRG